MYAGKIEYKFSPLMYSNLFQNKDHTFLYKSSECPNQQVLLGAGSYICNLLFTSRGQTSVLAMPQFYVVPHHV